MLLVSASFVPLLMLSLCTQKSTQTSHNLSEHHGCWLLPRKWNRLQSMSACPRPGIHYSASSTNWEVAQLLLQVLVLPWPTAVSLSPKMLPWALSTRLRFCPYILPEIGHFLLEIGHFLLGTTCCVSLPVCLNLYLGKILGGGGRLTAGLWSHTRQLVTHIWVSTSLGFR